VSNQSNANRAIQRIQERDADHVERYLDMQAAVYLPGEEEPALRVGGRWDTLKSCYTGGPCETEVEIHLTAAQADSWPIVCEWLVRYSEVRARMKRGDSIDEAMAAVWADRAPLFTLQLYGGRQGGKTHLATVMVALVCLLVPRARAAVASTVQEKSDEIVAILEDNCFPAEWRATVGNEMRLANGSEIIFRSGRVQDLKALGPLEIGMVNEAQEQKKKSWVDLQGNTLARGGLCVLAQNPPRRRIGEWTQDLFQDVKRGRQPGTRSRWINPALNTYTSSAAMGHLASMMSDKERRRDVLGDMGVAAGDTVLHEWTDSLHVIDWIPSTWDDVTSEVTRQMFGEAFDRVGGLDWDKGAGPSYSLGRLFRPYNAPEYTLILVVEYGQTFKGLAEAKFPEHLKGLVDKYGRPLARTSTTLWVGDSSGRYQSSRRKFTPDDHPSWQRMQDAGWRVTFVDPVEMRNPRRSDRFGLINDFVLALQPAINLPRVAMVADTAEHVIKASKGLPKQGLEASRRHRYAHVVDTWTYLAWRIFSQEFAARENGVPEAVARERQSSRL
jgi:hypothetical protein